MPTIPTHLQLPAERPWPGTTETVRREVDELSREGLDVQFVPSDFDDHFLLPPARQLEVTSAIEYWSQLPSFADTLLGQEANPVGAAWLGVAKRAIALHAFYNIGTIDTPSDGIDPEILDWPLFAGSKSARELTYEDKRAEYAMRRRDVTLADAEAEQVLQKYQDFFEAGSLWSGCADELKPGDFIAGSVDRLADVTRATTMKKMFTDHVMERYDEYVKRGVVTGSFGCGAAEPAYWLVKELEKIGIPVNAMNLVDGDPVALAASVSRAEANGLNDKIVLHRKNILKTPIEQYIEPQSMDFAEAIGVIEYMRRDSRGFKMAGNLLVDIARTVRPGGMLVFGNMLDDRPQQEWFTGIWPPLYQRPIREVVELLEEVGFTRDQLQVRIAEGEGVYALYGIKIPENGEVPRVSEEQRAIGARIMRLFPEY